MSDRMDVEVLGVKLGTASGWDELDTCNLYFYDVETSNTKFPSLEFNLNVDFNTGVYECHGLDPR